MTMDYTQEQIAQMTSEQFADFMNKKQQQQRDPSQSTSAQGPSTGGGAGNIMYLPAGYLQPPSLNDATNYDVWMTQFKVWEYECGQRGMDKTNIASMFIKTMGNKCPLKKNLAEKFHQKYFPEDIYGPGNYKLLMDFLKKELAGNEVQKACSTWSDLERCSRDEGESLEAFLDRFDSVYTAMAAANSGFVISSEIKAFMLIERSKVTGLEKTMVQSRLNLSDKSTMYDQAERALREVLGNGPGKSNKQDRGPYPCGYNC